VGNGLFQDYVIAGAFAFVPVGFGLQISWPSAQGAFMGVAQEILLLFTLPSLTSTLSGDPRCGRTFP